MMGIGVMIHYLGGGSKESADKYYGRTITDATIDPERSVLTFSDSVQVVIRDDGQSCCERRYMSTDDDLKSLVGATLQRIESKLGPKHDEDYDVHETCFVEIGTDKGFVTLVNHNEHN